MVLVPLDTPGVKIERMWSVFGEFDEPYGHGEVSFENVRLPLSSIIYGPGKGFEIAQGRLGPGRIHHCMRCIGASERALSLLIQRAQKRVAFGKPLLNLGGNREKIADLRILIDQAHIVRRVEGCEVGALGALTDIGYQIVAPNVLQRVADKQSRCSAVPACLGFAANGLVRDGSCAAHAVADAFTAV
jgi:alkylation response protein AidB-like acyl-CoA dehydrogenase